MPSTPEKLEKLAVELDKLQNEASEMHEEKVAFMIALAMEETDRALKEQTLNPVYG